MRARLEKMLDLLGSEALRFEIPLFQRSYTWSESQCEELLDDVLAAGRSGHSHFTGVLLFALDPESWGGLGRLRIIDGQQRMTTVTLLLVALERLINAKEAQIEGLLPGDITHRYLKATNKPDAPCRLRLAHLDRGTLAALIDDSECGQEHSARLVDNLGFFVERLAEDNNAQAAWQGLGQLQVITALMNADENPQEIFESLNSKGMPLTAGDLIRNALIFGHDEAQRRELYDTRWKPMQLLLDKAKGTTMDSLLLAWLAARFSDERVRNEHDVYSVLRAHLRQGDLSINAALDELSDFAERYVGDEQWRTRADKAAKEWLSDRPRATVAERRLFGD